MRVLVIGKAKTGTTALVHLIMQAMEPCRLVMEPKSILEFGADSLEYTGNEAIKIIHEHFGGRQRHLNAIVHAEFGFPVDKVVFITRDIRDEMISRLMYFAKPMRNQGLPKVSPEEKWSQWIGLLEQKEQRPQDLSFRALCVRFKAIFDLDVWANITRMQDNVQYENFRNKGIFRDRCVVAYEDMVAGRLEELEAYLGLSLQSDMSSLDLGPFGYTRRSGTAGNWRAFFTDEDVQILRPLIAAKLDDPRYQDWELDPRESLSPDDYSRYVARLALG